LLIVRVRGVLDQKLRASSCWTALQLGLPSGFDLFGITLNAARTSRFWYRQGLE
jgi:hypothetical protein